MNYIPDNLVILEMANNHMGDINHAFTIIDQFAEVCGDYKEFKFAFKLQYRDLDTFVHPKMQGRDDVKYIKRFSETKLSKEEFEKIVYKIRESGFIAMATPFDNVSIKTITNQNLDIIKIASCSFNDWPLLEDVVLTDLPIIASTAGAEVDDIDRVISFFQNRNKNFAIMHCVGEYPTADEKMNINQIDFLKTRYPDVRIGFSTHENPDNTDIVKMAIAKGASIFEKHVGVSNDKYSLNAYSASPQQLKAWLEAARYAKTVCGVEAKQEIININEKESLMALRRGIFIKNDIKSGDEIKASDIYFAFPPVDGQYTANNWSKYTKFVATKDIAKNEAVTPVNSECESIREKIWEIVQRVKKFLSESKISVPGGVELEISHHYGLDSFHKYGLTMITVVNRTYCKKLLISLPNQCHPEQYHKEKEETFHVLYGELHLSLNGKTKIYYPGDVIHIEPGIRHAFTSPEGVVIEEISSTHYKDDSFYTDESIMKNANRKTHMKYWM